jgi:Tol biopolymer transport system component
VEKRVFRRLAIIFLLAAVATLSRDTGTSAIGGTTTLVATGAGGYAGNGHSCCASITPDGRFVAFATAATNLDVNDNNYYWDAYVYDAQLNTLTRASLANNGASGLWDSLSPSISHDGRFVAFESSAGNLVSGDNIVCGNRNCSDIFIRDLLNQQTLRVSMSTSGSAGNGHSHNPSISGDGRFVAFESYATNLVADDTNDYCDYDFDGLFNDNCLDIFLHDRDADTDGIFDEPGARTTLRASVGPSGTQANGESRSPALSADGRTLAFNSDGHTLVANDLNNVPDVFAYDRQSQTTELVSLNSAEVPANSYSFEAAISGDGRYVGFSSYAGNLVTGDTNTEMDIFVRDRLAGTTERVGVDSNGNQSDWPSGFGSRPVSLSTDGRFVAFDSYAPNLVPGDLNSTTDVFMRDRLTSTTGRVSISSTGAESNQGSYSPVISGDGSAVAFDSWASNLASNDGNFSRDVFLHRQADTDGDGTWNALDANDDNDAWPDALEAACGSNPLVASSSPERIDTAGDDDGDAQTNEPLPAGAEAHDCDGDGYTGSAESNVGTSQQDPCGGSGWPSDLVAGGLQPNTLNIQDIGSYITPLRRFATSPGHPNFDVRWDLVPGGTIGGALNLQDVAAAFTGASGYPPMLGGVRAYGKTCPWPP